MSNNDDQTETDEQREGPMQPSFRERVARDRANENVEKWGQQSVMALVLAIGEEIGELAEEVVPPECPVHEHEARGATWQAAKNLSSTGDSVQFTLEKHFEDEDGEPADPRPPMVEEREDMDVAEVREELYDLAALCRQLDWAIYQGVREGEVDE